jgi:hypothetical protein
MIAGLRRVIEYIPIFVGKTDDGEKVVLYKKVDNPDQLHIKPPGGELWAIEPGANLCITNGFETTDQIRLQVTCRAWTGEATGTRYDVVAEEPIRI